MNRIFITLCILFAFITFASAGEMYLCVDRDGNSIVTSSPQDGMENCVLKDSYENTTPNEPAIEERDKPIEKTEEITKERETRIKNCISCCANKQQVCYNYTANDRLCAEGIKNCVATCKSEGNSSSEWNECWFQSEK
jgi:hypothetical protein